MLEPATERRLLQAAVSIGALSPLLFGLLGAIRGPAMVGQAVSTPDLESHYRFLSGIFFELGLVLLSCVPRIEARTMRFRCVTGAVVAGGLARLFGLSVAAAPSAAHLIGLCAELGLVPLLVLWQARVARLSAGAAGFRS